MSVAIGAKLPHTGAVAAQGRVAEVAASLEQAGFDSLWVSDHVALPGTVRSYYPFEPDGIARWPTDTPYVEALIALTAAATVTSRVRLGTAVLVLPQRNPVLLAKQAASIDALAPGRLSLGVGAGWLREEFETLDASFDDRGPRFVEWISLLRSCWTGRPEARSEGRYTLPEDMLILPAPAQPIPLYVGGHSPVALKRAGRIGDGWLAQQALPDLDVPHLRSEIDIVHAAATAAGRNPDDLRITLRLVGSSGRATDVATHLAALEDAGVHEVVVDVDPDTDPAGERAALTR
ncbi:TIGR03619 family F420-dependent LLM class oxidoreductase [Nakamurella sp. YIM 132087]|uniref:TIGR03619 family F420-dependent LLM class oxidoreductase n=1 Tax=Nakamurella alba TaxID=2665158 RepID=A0A7K1FLW9_9ACTN|nr:TIGR03619 family F420-dependent LLM class oxidoreductase [Nakamurella alba]MTD15106.1 TIGR03619 family F420-dependent LLM class oxidoreductase [Nakamurella alba]